MAVGYSGTPLIKKLGMQPDRKILLLGEPANYFDLLEEDISSWIVQKGQPVGLIHLFVRSKIELDKHARTLLDHAKSNPELVIWISWFKKSAGIATDVTEDTIRSWALKNGLVDIKVCAVSEKWSGLKLVIPKSKRAK